MDNRKQLQEDLIAAWKTVKPRPDNSSKAGLSGAGAAVYVSIIPISVGRQVARAELVYVSVIPISVARQVA